MKCKRCERNDEYDAITIVDDLCESCFDFLNGHSSYDPAKPNPMLEAVQQTIWENEDDGFDDEGDNEIEDFDGICVFCGEELEYTSTGGVICRNCGYDEDYERSKVSGDDY